MTTIEIRANNITVTIADVDTDEGTLQILCSQGMWCARPADQDEVFTNYNDAVNAAIIHAETVEGGKE